VVLVIVTSLFAGCFEDEETPPSPEPRVELVGPSEAWVGEAVQFETVNVRDDDTEFEALDFFWEMGDNTTYKGKPFVSEWIAAVNHTFTSEGMYNVTVTVTDLWDNQGIANFTVFVRYQLNMTVNARGTWLSEDALNNTTYFNMTIQNVWTDQFDVPRILPRMMNDTGGYINPRATTGDPVPANMTAGQSITFQVHFSPPPEFVPETLWLCPEFCLDMVDDT
jgi:hypothetical protein